MRRFGGSYEQDHVRVLNFLYTHYRSKGFMPSQREIADEVGWRSTSCANETLHRMEREGLIVVHRPFKRAITITDAGMVALTDVM